MVIKNKPDGHFGEIAAFAWNERKKHIILTFMILIFFFGFVLFPWGSAENNTGWWNWCEPIVGMTTLTVAVFVWIGEVVQDWHNSLPKRLTVVFLYNGQKCMRCEKAYLAGEGDIRAWGQQLGGQMARIPQLSFEPSIKQLKGKIVYDPDIEKKIKLYTVEFYLTELPKEYEVKGEVVNEKEIKNLRLGKCLIWKFDPDKEKFEKKWKEAG